MPVFDHARYEVQVPALEAAYAGGKEFPHIVLDDFLDGNILAEALAPVSAHTMLCMDSLYPL